MDIEQKDEDIITWEQYQILHPCKPYEQSEKYGDYDQRKINHVNNLYVEYLKLYNQSTLK